MEEQKALLRKNLKYLQKGYHTAMLKAELLTPKRGEHNLQDDKIVSMEGVTREEFEKALKLLFPELIIFCIWEAEDQDEF